jgi:hypothetical protein
MLSMRDPCTQISPPSAARAEDQLQDRRLPEPLAPRLFRVPGQQRKAHFPQHDLVIKGQRDLVEDDGRTLRRGPPFEDRSTAVEEIAISTRA